MLLRTWCGSVVDTQYAKWWRVVQGWYRHLAAMVFLPGYRRRMTWTQGPRRFLS